MNEEWRQEILDMVAMNDLGQGADVHDILVEGFKRRYWEEAIIQALSILSMSGDLINHGNGRFALAYGRGVASV